MFAPELFFPHNSPTMCLFDELGNLQPLAASSPVYVPNVPYVVTIVTIVPNLPNVTNVTKVPNVPTVIM